MDALVEATRDAERLRLITERRLFLRGILAEAGCKVGISGDLKFIGAVAPAEKNKKKSSNSH